MAFVKLIDVEHLLDTFTFEEILEYNEVTEADVLQFLVEQRILRLPNPRPVDV